jgi:hypothetical protein
VPYASPNCVVLRLATQSARGLASPCPRPLPASGSVAPSFRGQSSRGPSMVPQGRSGSLKPPFHHPNLPYIHTLISTCRGPWGLGWQECFLFLPLLVPHGHGHGGMDMGHTHTYTHTYTNDGHTSLHRTQQLLFLQRPGPASGRSASGWLVSGIHVAVRTAGGVIDLLVPLVSRQPCRLERS